jgi:hypothetical protein
MAEDFLSREPRLILMFGDLQSAPVNYTRIVFTDFHVEQYNVTNLDGISSPMRNVFLNEPTTAEGEPTHWAPDLGKTIIDFHGSYFGTLYEDRHTVCHAKDLDAKYESHLYQLFNNDFVSIETQIMLAELFLTSSVFNTNLGSG